MKSISYFIAMLAIVLFASCGSSSEDDKKTKVNPEDANARVIASDVHYYCWFNEHTLQKGIVHSKPLASKIDSVYPDSYGFRGYFRDLGDNVPKGVRVSFWTYWKETGANAKLVFGVDSADVNTFWVGMDLIDTVKTANQWQRVNCYLNFPKKTRMDDKLTVYLWSVDKKEMYMDDLELKFIY